MIQPNGCRLFRGGIKIKAKLWAAMANSENAVLRKYEEELIFFFPYLLTCKMPVEKQLQ